MRTSCDVAKTVSVRTTCVWGDRVVVEVEADVGGLASLDSDAFEQRQRRLGQRQQTFDFLGEHLAHATLRLGRAAAIGGDAQAPVSGLGIEIVEIAERTGGEECLAHVADGALDAALLVAARHGNGARLVTVVPGEAQQRWMEADRITMPFQHGTLQIVVEQDARNTTKHLERLGMAAQEVLHASIEAEVQEELPRVA